MNKVVKRERIPEMKITQENVRSWKSRMQRRMNRERRRTRGGGGGGV